MAAFHQVAARHFDQDRIGHCAGVTTTFRHDSLLTSHTMAAGLKTFRRRLRIAFLAVFILPLAARGGLYALNDHPRSWRDANWASTGLLPPAADDPPARVPRVCRSRRRLAQHCRGPHLDRAQAGERCRLYALRCIGVRHAGAHQSACRPTATGSAASRRSSPTSAASEPATAIPKIEAAVTDYPYAADGSYRVWPGPNSNTFTATLLGAAPELAVAMPSEAVGRDFRADGSVAGLTASRTDSSSSASTG